MADAISIQELIDARTDAKTLEEAVNGDAVTTVLSRLGETYPTLSNALNQIDGKISDANDMLVESVTTLFTNGGLPATPFATKALMTASALVDGDYAMVTDDTDNNGLYVKTAGAWVKSAYDPTIQANQYTDENAASVDNFKVTSTNDGFFFLTSDDIPLFYVLNNGDFHLCGDKEDLRKKVAYSPKENINPYLFEFKDSMGQLVAYLDSQADFYIVGNNNSMQQQIKKIEQANLLTLKISSISEADGGKVLATVAANNLNQEPKIIINVVEEFGGSAGLIQRIGAILELPDNKILFVWGGGQGALYNGDGEGVKLYSRIITYNDYGGISDYGVKKLERETTDPAGIAKHPLLGRTATNRIVMIWDERDSGYTNYGGDYTTMLAFSDDEGVSFTEAQVIPKNPNESIQISGSTGRILTLSTGRLICPMYAAGITMMYSDDNGLSWSYGETLFTYGGRLQEPSVTVDENDVIYISSRSTSRTPQKHLSVSTDGGLTITEKGFQEELPSQQVASSIYYDKDNGLMFHSTSRGHNRIDHVIQISSNKGDNWQLTSQIVNKDMYVGYTQFIKLSNGMYALCAEGLKPSIGINKDEDIGVIIFNLKGVLDNVYSN